MSASITSSVCALCRRPLPAGDTGSSATRLCDSCRKMVDNIRPAATRGTTGPTTNAPTHQPDPRRAPKKPTKAASNSNIAGAVPQQGTLQNPAWATAPTPEPQPNPTWANTPSQEPAAKPDLNNAPSQAPPAKNGFSNPPRRQPPANPAWSDVVMVPSGPDSREAPFQPSTEESAYHQNWPIMVEERPTRKRGKGILILALFVVMAGAAAVGFLVFKDKIFGPRGGSSGGTTTTSSNRRAADVEPKPQDPKSVPAPAAQDSAKPLTSSSSQSPAGAASPVAPVAAASVDSGKPAPGTQPAQATQPGQAAGAKMMSFQAASFPNEASAKQFQDRLVQAGLP